MSLRKSFYINERMNFQWGMNAYNGLNYANYGAPYASMAFGPTNFGTVIFTQTPPTFPCGAFPSAATDKRRASNREACFLNGPSSHAKALQHSMSKWKCGSFYCGSTPEYGFQ